MNAITLSKNTFTDFRNSFSCAMKKIRKQALDCEGSRESQSFVKKNTKTKREYDYLVFIVFVGKGCFWARKNGGCTMCGFYNTTAPHAVISKGLIFKQFVREYKKYSSIKGKIKILLYTSGSFLDEGEVSDFDANQIFNVISEDNRIVQVDLESLPRFINREKLGRIKQSLKNTRLGISIGLESADEQIRNLIINKDFFLLRPRTS